MFAEIEKATGVRPTGCPWRALRDPFVRAVQDAYPWAESGELRLRWGADPPHALILGVEVYRRALRATQAHDTERRDEARRREAERNKPKRPPDPQRPGIKAARRR